MRAAAAAVFATLAVACSAVPPVGPLGQPGDDHAWGWSTSLEVGHRFADGQILLHVPDGVEVAVIDVQPLLSGGGLEPLGFRLAGPDRPLLTVQQIDSWPPDDPDLPGVLEPGGVTLVGDDAWWGDVNRGWELVVGFEVTGAGRTTVQGYRVIYDHGGRRHSLVVPSTLAVCAHEPATPPPADCEVEDRVRVGRS